MTDPAEQTFVPFLPPRVAPPAAAHTPSEDRLVATLPPSPAPLAGPMWKPATVPTTGQTMGPMMGSMAGATLLDVGPPPRPAKRRRPVALLGAAAVIALGVGAAVIAVGSSHKAEARYSLTSAAASAESAQNVAYEMTLGFGDSASAVATGRFDVAQGLMAMDMTMPGLGDARVQVIFDMNSLVMYMDASAFAEQGIDAPTRWVSLDVGAAPGMAEVFQQTSSNNPLDVAKVFDDADDVVDLGVEDFRGEQVKHYHVTVATADALAAYPGLQQQIAQLGSAFPAEMTYEVFVSADSQLRRVVYDMPAAGQSISADIVFTAVGAIEPISVPAPDDVTDFASLPGA